VTKKHVDAQAEQYMPTRGKIEDPLRSGADSILRAVDKGGKITLETLTELLELLRTKTDYQFHVEVAIIPSKSALLKTIDNERDAKETIRRLRTKP
jgi:ADP-dependent phosphofructokinase/glucokinase